MTALPRPSLVKSSRWVFLRVVASRLIQFSGNIVLARELGPAGLGVLGLVNSAASTLNGVVALGLGEGLCKHVAENYRHDHARASKGASQLLWFSLIFSFSALLILWGLRSHWISWIFPPSSSSWLVPLALMLAWMNLCMYLLNNTFGGLQLYQYEAALSLLQTALALILAIVFASQWGADGAVLGYLIATCVAAVAGFGLLRRKIGLPEWPQPNLIPAPRVLTYSLPLWIGQFIGPPFVTLSLAYLAAQPNGTHELGLFNVGNTLKTILVLFPGIIGSISMPALFQTGGRHGDANEHARLIQQSLIAIGFVTLPLLVVIMWAAEIVQVIYGPTYADARLIVVLMTATAGVAAMCAPLNSALLSKGHSPLSTVLNTLNCFAWYSFARLLVGDYLGLGLAGAMLLAQLIHAVLLVEIGCRFSETPPVVRSYFWGYVLVIAGLVAGAWSIPPIVRYLAALPLAGVVCVLIIRKFPELLVWINSLLPRPIRLMTRMLTGTVIAPERGNV